LVKSYPDAAYELLSRIGELHARVRADEESCTDFVFKIADTSTDHGFSGGQSTRRYPETASFGSR
jgi:hypothetical protein